MSSKHDIFDVVVVGGGPAGLAAAIEAARAGFRTAIMEARDEPAHTIRPTGDGRCNVANDKTTARDYRNPDFVARVFARCKPDDAIAWLEGAGLMLRMESEGRLYPQANKSTSVIEVLLAAARRAGVEFRCGHEAAAVRRNTDIWSVADVAGNSLRARSVVVACGKRLTADMLPSDVDLLPFEPVLGPIACDSAPIKGLDKIRVKCALSCGNQREVGEVTFRTYGISGICAFNLSRVVKPGDVLLVDFAPGMKPADTMAFLRDRVRDLRAETWADFCTGLLLPQVARCVLAVAKLPEDARPGEHALAAFEAAWRRFPLIVQGLGDAKVAQVSRGGVDVGGVLPRTMEVKGHTGLHVAGECVDVDGPCGGYNLHWAWASGIVAGRAAAADIVAEDAARAAAEAQALAQESAAEDSLDRMARQVLASSFAPGAAMPGANGFGARGAGGAAAAGMSTRGVGASSFSRGGRA